MKALIIEDSKIDGALLSRLLSVYNIESILIKHREELASTLKEHTDLSLVFIDLTLGTESGFDILADLKKHNSTHALRSIILTSSNQMADIQKALSLGASEFIIKPVSASIIREKLNLIGIQVETTVKTPSVSSLEKKTLGEVKFKVLVVDDASTIRSILKKTITEHPRLSVVGAAPEGKTAIDMMKQLKPDIITLDVEMPVMNGIEVLRAMKAASLSIPVIMCSSLTTQGASVTLQALELGATDYVAKPTGTTGGQNWGDFSAELNSKLLTLCESQHKVLRTSKTTPPLTAVVPKESKLPFDVLLVGSSTGGPAALQVFLDNLERDLPIPTVIVQHMPPHFTKLLADRLSHQTGHRVSEITNDEHLEAGGIYLAPGGFHAELRGHQGGIKAVTTEAPLVHGCRPSVDVCFKSALKLATLNPIIVMLTGMGRDGAENTKLLHERGATVIVQDEATSVVWGMPGAVVECNAADYILPLPEIGSTVSRLIHKIKREGKAVSHEQ